MVPFIFFIREKTVARIRSDIEASGSNTRDIGVIFLPAALFLPALTLYPPKTDLNSVHVLVDETVICNSLRSPNREQIDLGAVATAFMVPVPGRLALLYSRDAPLFARYLPWAGV